MTRLQLKRSIAITELDEQPSLKISILPECPQIKGGPHGVMVKAMDCEFVLQSH